MLRLSDTAFWRAGRRWAWAGGFGLLLSGAATATAQDCAPVCGAPGGCDPICSAPCGTYDAMTHAATGCGSVVGDYCDSCDDGCDGCGTDCCDLGDPWRLTDCLDLSCFDLSCGSGACCDTICDDACEGMCDGGLGCDGCGDDDGGPTIGGWVQFGYHRGSNGLFNNRPGRFANHQSYLFLEDVADGSNGWDLGWRGDVVYGIDAADTQAFGNPPNSWDFNTSPSNFFNNGSYGWAIPQLYAEAAYCDFSVIAGKFYTLLGYEVVTAPDNFFYSHAFTQYTAEAFTHTGVLTTYEAGDNLTLYNGYTFGWDTGFDQLNPVGAGAGSNYLGGASVGLSDSLTVTYITTAGNLGFVGDGYSHSIVADLAIDDSWNYVFQSDYLDTRLANVVNRRYGVNQYLFYTVNDCIALGARGEWFNNNGVDIGSITGGVNLRPTANLIIRPEYRYQMGSAAGLAAIGNGGGSQGGIFGIDAILTF